MYDEQKGITEVKSLSKDAKCVLSHVLRNGLCNILSAHCLDMDVQEEIRLFESRIEGLGL